MKNLLFLLFLFLGGGYFSVLASSETSKVIKSTDSYVIKEVTASYITGGNDSLDQAKMNAIDKAVKYGFESTQIFMQITQLVENGTLTKDQMMRVNENLFSYDVLSIQAAALSNKKGEIGTIEYTVKIRMKIQLASEKRLQELVGNVKGTQKYPWDFLEQDRCTWRVCQDKLKKYNRYVAPHRNCRSWTIPTIREYRDYQIPQIENGVTYWAGDAPTSRAIAYNNRKGTVFVSVDSEQDVIFVCSVR